ncbi:MAG: hypothetical protein J6M53_02860 [Bacteroidaceae bacterium]|nr:hypothetical protein [Bacteroidaceae bacterium]
MKRIFFILSLLLPLATMAQNAQKFVSDLYELAAKMDIPTARWHFSTHGGGDRSDGFATRHTGSSFWLDVHRDSLGAANERRILNFIDKHADRAVEASRWYYHSQTRDIDSISYTLLFMPDGVAYTDSLRRRYERLYGASAIYKLTALTLTLDAGERFVLNVSELGQLPASLLRTEYEAMSALFTQALDDATGQADTLYSQGVRGQSFAHGFYSVMPAHAVRGRRNVFTGAEATAWFSRIHALAGEYYETGGIRNTNITADGVSLCTRAGSDGAQNTFFGAHLQGDTLIVATLRYADPALTGDPQFLLDWQRGETAFHNGYRHDYAALLPAATGAEREHLLREQAEDEARWQAWARENARNGTLPKIIRAYEDALQHGYFFNRQSSTYRTTPALAPYFREELKWLRAAYIN